MNKLVIGHRGYRELYPENTLQAFSMALESGADGIECDLQKTSDGNFIIIHDDTIDRTSDSTGNVSGMTLENLKKFDFGNGQAIPELNEFLGFLPRDCFLDLELKGETLSSEDCPEICRILSIYRSQANTMISSFQIDLLDYFRKAGFITGFLIGDSSQAGKPISILAGLIRLGPSHVNLPVEMFRRIGKVMSRIIIFIFRLSGRKFAFWTVNTHEEADLCLKYADIIITDRVEFIVSYLTTTSSRSKPVDM